MHPTALPSKYGIGDFGDTSKNFIDFLNDSSTKIWQVLPLGLTSLDEFSPYSSPSSILGNRYLIDVEQLTKYEKIDIVSPQFSNDYVQYKEVYRFKDDIFKNVSKNINLQDKIFSSFLDDSLIRKHITFLILKDLNQKSWNEWDNIYQEYSDDLFDKLFTENTELVNFHVLTQYEFFNQWGSLKKYANDKNVKILGDIPIYVNHDSADVWLNKEMFELDETGNMELVSGAVPDSFNMEGQIWGNALYRWDLHKEDNFKYWKEKLNKSLNLYDYLRIDHFIGFFKFWAIPYGKSALDGHWRDGPWETFFEKISNNVNFNKLLAEDLGVVLDTTAQILEKYGIPGMKVLQQRIPDKTDHDEINPKNWSESVVAYTGTHDSPTIRQWFDETSSEQINFFNQYKKELNNKFESDVWNFISMTWESPCKVAITTIQDLLELGAEGRFNLPGTQKGNWKWRIEDLDQLSEPLEKLKLLNQACERVTT